MQIKFSEDDDRGVLEAMMEHARQLRRKRPSKGALTAAKVEVMFSKAIEQISSGKAEEATLEVAE